MADQPWLFRQAGNSGQPEPPVPVWPDATFVSTPPGLDALSSPGSASLPAPMPGYPPAVGQAAERPAPAEASPAAAAPAATPEAEPGPAAQSSEMVSGPAELSARFAERSAPQPLSERAASISPSALLAMVVGAITVFGGVCSGLFGGG